MIIPCRNPACRPYLDVRPATFTNIRRSPQVVVVATEWIAKYTPLDVVSVAEIRQKRSDDCSTGLGGSGVDRPRITLRRTRIWRWTATAC